MKEFLQIQFDSDQCRKELALFRNLLDGKKELEENADVKPFFEANKQLAAFLGSLSWNIICFDLLAFQYQLFGDYGCDMVVGDSVHKSYGFIEWEDATSASIFRPQGKKATPEWSARFEHGFSQIVDWFCKLDDMARTDEFEARFGARNTHYFGLLVVGRDEGLAHPRERRRWEWRSQKVVVNSLLVWCLTYDQLYDFLSRRLNFFSHRLPRQKLESEKQEGGSDGPPFKSSGIAVPPAPPGHRPAASPPGLPPAAAHGAA
jgi:hypothetical protein